MSFIQLLLPHSKRQVRANRNSACSTFVTHTTTPLRQSLSGSPSGVSVRMEWHGAAPVPGTILHMNTRSQLVMRSINRQNVWPSQTQYPEPQCLLGFGRGSSHGCSHAVPRRPQTRSRTPNPKVVTTMRPPVQGAIRVMNVGKQLEITQTRGTAQKAQHWQQRQ